jgi:glutaredoxin 3
LGRVGVQQGELVREQPKHLGMRLRGLEQPRHRVAGTSGGIQRLDMVAEGWMHRDRVDAGDRVEISAAVVQDQADVEERLQPGPETTPSPPGAFGDRAQAPMVQGVEVQDPVGLAVADRAQHDCFGLQRGRHAARPPPSNATLFEAMSLVTVFTTEHCSRCVSAKILLERRGIAYREVNLARDPDGRAELARRTGMVTFPQIVIGERSVGGFDQLLAADRDGRLGELLAA